MKGKFFRRVLSGALGLSMAAAMLPVSAFAENVTTTPGNTSLDVEYFTSTLYNWDEDAANAATAEADKTTGYASTTVAYSTVASENKNSYTSTSYYYLVDGTYYPVYYTRTETGSGRNKTTTYTLYYKNGSNYTQIGSTTNGNDTVTLYTNGGYEGKGFYFTNASYRYSSPVFSEWNSDAQNYMIYSGLAASKLSDSSNAPFNDETVNAANLFATDGSNDDYADVYTNVGVPFVYDSTTGYYTLDSDQWAVYFDGGSTNAASNTNLTIADKPAAHSYTSVSGYSYATGFLPFDDVTTTTKTAVKSGGTSSSNEGTTAYTTSSTTWGFGMVTSVNFQMTDDGKDANGDPITFEFSGDDDVWVYIDGYLVLDIGGTHDAITGTINFATGEVELTAGSYGQIGDMAVTGDYSTTTTSPTLSQENIYSVLDTTLTGFASSGNHTLTIYYMERGRGRSNCLIKFNLPQKDSVSVTKTIDENYTSSEYEISDDVMKTLNNMDFTFTLYNGSSVVANTNYSLYDSDGNLVGTGSTDSAGTFTLKNGQTATFKNISLDEESSYYVVETSPGDRWTAKWTATSSVSDATISGGSGLTSDTVTVTGSSTATDTISFVCENSYSYGSVQPDVDTNDDTIVLDYGLPVEVDVLANDNVTAYGVAVESTMTLVGADENGKVTGTYGYAEIKDGNIVYTLTRDFCGIETIQYTVSASAYNTETKKEETQSGTATLTIIPATSVYYEEDFTVDYGDTAVTVADWNDASNFITIATNSASFTEVGSDIGGYQETGFVGTTTDSTYGTDEVYLNNLCDSYGTSLKVDTSKGSAQYKYTFTGTGTTIYGRVSSATGYIKVTINAVDEDGNETTKDTQLIDTINLYDKGTDTLDETLYNIPIYQNTGLHYGTYVVRVYVYEEETYTGTRDSGGEFYLDGIRVFNPMGTEDENGDEDAYATAASAYATDGEANTAVVNIREKIVADAEEEYSNSIFTLTDINGAIVNVSAETTSEEDDDSVYYNDIGPNEEFYLKEGYSLEFALVGWDSQKYKLYLGLKAPNGSEASVTFTNGDDTELGTIEVKNSADCYYDISSYVVVEDGIGYVYIEGVSGLTALTNIKVTGVDAFNLAYATDEDVNDEGDDGTATATLYMVSTAYAASLSEEAEEEVEVFTPEYIKNSCSYASKTKKATVNVVTSTDVSYVTINGEQVSAKTVSGKYRFTKNYTKVEAGTTYEIVCYNADGVASETYTVTAK